MHIKKFIAQVPIVIGAGFISLLLTGSQAIAQSDTLSLNLQQTDRLFLEKNLQLLAGTLNVTSKKALEIQSRSYPNPQFSAELNLRDPDNDKWAHIGNSGEKAFAIEQLIVMGGKRKNEIELARQNTRQAELELAELLRHLKLQLRSSFYSIYFDELILKKYNAQLQVLDTIITSYDVQVAKGNISPKEAVRLKSVYLKLNNDKSELLQELQEQRKQIQLLLQTSSFVQPSADVAQWDEMTQLLPADSLLSLALEHRPDWKLAELNADIAALNLKYQKSLAVPDLTLGANYDQRGGAFGNQVNMTAGIPLPLWNRNRGNIQSAHAGIRAADINLELQRSAIAAEVNQAWNDMNRSIQEYRKVRQLYSSQFAEVFNGITDNFRKRNISILEFVDFFESYNESVAEVNRIRKQLVQSAEEVNFTIGTTAY